MRQSQISKNPILLTEVASAIRAHGIIWLILPMKDSGTLFRAQINRQQIRVLLPKLGKKATLVEERGSIAHTVKCMQTFLQFLNELTNANGHVG